MKDLFTVAKFTMNDMIRRKSFIISNIIILVIIVLLINVPNFIKMIKGDNTDDSQTPILIIDSNNIFEGTLEQMNNMNIGYKVTIINEPMTFDEIKDKMQKDEIEEAMLINYENNEIHIEYIIKNLAMVSQMPDVLLSTVSSIYSNLKISQLGLTPEQLETLNTNFKVDMKQTEEEEVQGNIFSMMMLSIVLFYAIYFCAYQVSSSITTEKTSKIIETLVTSTTPKTIVLGKTIGIGTVGLLQIVAMVVTALVSNAIFLEDGMLDQFIDFSTITPFLGIITAIYFILGYALYALLYALTGSTVSKPEDVQSANGPIAIVAVIGFYLAYFTMMNPTSELNKLAAILPISSPFCMPFRVMMGIASNKDIIVSIAVLLVSILIIAKVSIKIYSQAILNYGNKISFKDIVKLYKNKNV